MADEDKFLEEDVTAEPGDDTGSSQVKEGFLPGLLINLLKWGSLFIIFVLLVVTISWATYTLFFNKGRSAIGMPQSYSPEQAVVDLKLTFYKGGLDGIRGQTADQPPRSFVISVALGYPDKATTIQTELVDKTDFIHNIVLKYIGERTADELATKNLDKLEDDLKSILNKNVLRSGLIQQVLISELQVF